MWLYHNSSPFGNELKLCQLQQDCWFIRNLEKHSKLGTDRSVSHAAAEAGNIKCTKRLFLKTASASCKNHLEIFSHHKRERKKSGGQQTHKYQLSELWVSLANAVCRFSRNNTPSLNHRLTTEQTGGSLMRIITCRTCSLWQTVPRTRLHRTEKISVPWQYFKI